MLVQKICNKPSSQSGCVAGVTTILCENKFAGLQGICVQSD